MNKITPIFTGNGIAPYVASKAPWFTISDDLPQFAELPK